MRSATPILFPFPRALLMLWLALACLVSTPAVAQKRVGLVIGIDRYSALPTSAQLNKAVADARAVRDMLRVQLRFDHVVFGENATLAEARDLLSDFSRRLKPGDLAFVFFAGHGANVRLANYLLPSDLPPMRDVSSEAQVRLEEENMIERSISEERIRELITLAGARAAIVVLDACRNNIFREALMAAGPRSRSLAGASHVQGARPIDRPRSQGTQFLSLYSASPGQRALDALGPQDHHPNSPFTRILVARMPTPGQRVYEIMRGLRAEVAGLAAKIGHEQVPAITDEAIDEVVLVGQAAPAPAPPAPAPATPALAIVATAPPAAAPAAPPQSAVAAPPAAVPAAKPGATAPVEGMSRSVDGWTGWKLAVKSNAAISVQAVMPSPDGRIAAVSYRDQALRFWSLSKGKLIGTIAGIGDVPTELAFDPRGELLASNGGGGIQVWSATAFKAAFTLPLGERVTALAFTEDGSAIVARANRGAIRAFVVGSRQERTATPDDAALLTNTHRRSARTTSITANGNSVRLVRGRRGGEAVAMLAFNGGDWIGIAEDGLTHTGTEKAIAAFDLIKGRDRLPVTEAFISSYRQPDGLQGN